ncbi:SitI3 family protein [Paenibacillus sp. MMS20-IR301]|uniref:SitI3 family protein n=1 Tax=Paenibacillus sp. MMS20-IR301 TaxID=2895946 RepID=UPI0028EDB917|nr:SitI3 family protein [Paenibacillus sp. MMS20-IR301]WNS43307.1 SitI3 family protein [Paenibacillus sp. MMS20-IR301]
MAIEYSLKVEKKISEELLIQELESIGYANIQIVRLTKGIEINQFEKTFGLNLCLTDSSDYPYNAMDTQFLRNEFVYETTLSFRFINNIYNNESYKFMLSLVFNLLRNHNLNALLLSNGDNELCFFAKENIYLENSSYIWDNGCFAEVLKGRSYYYYYDGNYIF